MWKQFKAFVDKEFIHIIRDPYTLMILLLLPVIEMILFGFALNMDVTGVRTLIVDQSSDRYAQHIQDKMKSSPDFILYDVTQNSMVVDDLMKANKIDLAIVLPENLEQDITTGKQAHIQLIVDSTDPNSAKIKVAYVSALIASVISDDTGNQSVPYSIDVSHRMLYNPSMHSAYNFVPGIMALVMIILCTIMTSVSIAREKERGNMELLLTSPAHPTMMVLAKAFPFFVVSLINLATILLLSYFVLEVPIRGSLILIIFISMIYIFLALAIGLAISSLVEQQRDAVIISGFGMMMPTIIFSGMLFPIMSMPSWLQWVSYLVPARYYIDAIRKVMIQGLSIIGVWEDVLAIMVMGTLMIILAVINVKPRLGRTKR